MLEHPGFIHDQCGPGAEPVLGQWWPVGALPFIQQLGHGVRRHAGVTLQDAGRLRRRGDTEHRPAVGAEVLHGGGEHSGLAGAGRTDHQHEPGVAGGGGRCIRLHHIEARPVEGHRRERFVGLGVHRPRNNLLLLDQDRLGGEPRCRGFDPHRPCIRRPPRRHAGGIQVDAVVEHEVGGSFEGVGPTVSRQLRHGRLPVADRLHDIGPAPRRPLRRHRLDDLVDRQHDGQLRVVCGLLEGGV